MRTGRHIPEVEKQGEETPSEKDWGYLVPVYGSLSLMTEVFAWLVYQQETLSCKA